MDIDPRLECIESHHISYSLLVRHELGARICTDACFGYFGQHVHGDHRIKIFLAGIASSRRREVRQILVRDWSAVKYHEADIRRPRDVECLLVWNYSRKLCVFCE